MKKDKNITIYVIILLCLGALTALLVYGSNSNQVSVEIGDTVHVEYTGRLLDGTVFDTSDPELANSSGIYNPGRIYQPLKFVVGSGMMIEGFDKGVIGMREGEKKTLTIPPEQAYGSRDPGKINVLPLTDEMSITQAISNEIGMPRDQFNNSFGTDYTVGDTVPYPGSTLNMTVVKMNEFVNLSLDVNIGDIIEFSQTPWKEEVIKINSTHTVLKHKVKKNDIIQFKQTPWNSTVIEVNNTSFTIRHNPIPDQTIQTLYGAMNIHFNESSITLDANRPLAGKTLVFDIEVVKIEKVNEVNETENCTLN
jgi:FKBP-type peptidyl-prolyl cis-trans isomerase 2